MSAELESASASLLSDIAVSPSLALPAANLSSVASLPGEPHPEVASTSQADVSQSVSSSPASFNFVLLLVALFVLLLSLCARMWSAS